jgi:hypothetical protein
MYACDDHWWDLYINELKRDFAGELWTQSARSHKRYGVKRWEGVSLPGLGKTQIHFGNNSGYQAINLAYLFGATRIVLLGFDMKRDAGKLHFFGSHPYHKHTQGPDDAVMKRWCVNFDGLAADLKSEGVEVINATRSTALDSFPKQQLEQIC